MNTVINAIRSKATAQLALATPLGTLRLVRTAVGLSGAWFDGQKHHPGSFDVPEDPEDTLLADAADQLHAYFDSAGAASFDLPCDLHGTPFQRQVWHALRRIPSGQTRSYAAVAAELGAPNAVRAVGAAVGRNPLSIIVPCHRVLGSDGALTGYAGGLERKRRLLALEADEDVKPLARRA